MTRATRWICVSTTEGEDAPFLDRFRELERSGQMTIKAGVDRESANATVESDDHGRDEEDDLTDLF